MRVAPMVAWLALARLAGATCLDDCLTRYGGSGPDYAASADDDEDRTGDAPSPGFQSGDNAVSVTVR